MPITEIQYLYALRKRLEFSNVTRLSTHPSGVLCGEAEDREMQRLKGFAWVVRDVEVPSVCAVFRPNRSDANSRGRAGIMHMRSCAGSVSDKEWEIIQSYIRASG